MLLAIEVAVVAALADIIAKQRLEDSSITATIAIASTTHTVAVAKLLCCSPSLTSIAVAYRRLGHPLHPRTTATVVGHPRLRSWGTHLHLGSLGLGRLTSWDFAKAFRFYSLRFLLADSVVIARIEERLNLSS
jgi:hypothetical protein